MRTWILLVALAACGSPSSYPPDAAPTVDAAARGISNAQGVASGAATLQSGSIRVRGAVGQVGSGNGAPLPSGSITVTGGVAGTQK